jgi:serine/threonine protein kinase
MLVQVRCPNSGCGRLCGLGDDHLGRIFRCPRCQTKLPRTGSIALRGWPDFPNRIASRHEEVPPAIESSQTPVPVQVQVKVEDFWDEEPIPSFGSSDHTTLARVGRFRVRTTLGSGAFATVYRAYDPLLGRDVALKVLRAEGPTAPRVIERFLHESEILARLRHPRIVPLLESGRDGVHHYISSAYIAGQSLDQALEAGPVSPGEAARIAFDLADALAYVHTRGIIHRDVKPANILLDPNGAPHLVDFGLAHRREVAGPLMSSDEIVGTPAYMAPEQARGGPVVPIPANDQYSLGVVLFELLCGRPPFSGPPSLVLLQAVSEEPALPRSLRPGVPKELEAICLKALAKRPEDRFHSCRALAEHLNRWLRSKTFAPSFRWTDPEDSAMLMPAPLTGR